MKKPLAADLSRLAGVASVTDIAAQHVADLRRLPAKEIAPWLNRLELPPGWRIAGLEGSVTVPSRVAVCDQLPDGRWSGCETVSVFGYTGDLPEDVIRACADSTLRSIGAERIEVRPVSPLGAGVTVVGSDGYVEVAGRRVWVRYTTYVTGVGTSDAGYLVQQSITVSSDCRVQFAEDIELLGDALQRELVASFNVY